MKLPTTEPPFASDDLLLVCEGIANLDPILHDARILISGGTGFFGRWLLESLLYANAHRGANLKATVLARNPAAFLARVPHLAVPVIQWVQGSVTTMDAIGAPVKAALWAGTAYYTHVVEPLQDQLVYAALALQAPLWKPEGQSTWDYVRPGGTAYQARDNLSMAEAMADNLRGRGRMHAPDVRRPTPLPDADRKSVV